MRPLSSLVSTLSLAGVTLAAVALRGDQPDPCAAIAGRPLVPPEEVLACLRSFPFNETIRQNLLANANGVLDFFTFEPYYLRSPKPFQESTIDIRAELKRMAKKKYASDYDFNIDLYNTTLRLNDGHTGWTPPCYLSYQYLLPTPIVGLLKNGKENIYIIPELVDFVSSLSPDLVDYLAEIGFAWQRLAGAKVLAINGKSAYSYVDTVARESTGNFLDHGIRVNSVFWSYKRFTSSFGQRFGGLASANLPTLRGLEFKVLLANATKPEVVFVPYVASRIGAAFTDSASYWENNCAVRDDTNGYDLYSDVSIARRAKKQPMGFILESPGQKEAVGVGQLDPTMPPVSIGRKMSLAFFVLPNSTTGVMTVGDFTPASTYDFQAQALAGVQKLLEAGATSLIVDVHNNGGGLICLGQFLYAVLAGTNAGYPGFDSSHRASPMAQQIVKYYVENDLSWMWYSPGLWAFPNDTRIPNEYNYNDPPETIRVNGVPNRNSRRFHDTCEQDWWAAELVKALPAEPPFPLDKVAVVSNGNCASTCAMFTTLLHERHGVKMVVFGGKPGEPIEYKGMAGNQVLEWRDIDTEIKTGKAKGLPGAPPDLIVSGNFRVNWRTAWSHLDKTKPIEYKSEPAIRFPYTEDTYSNPQNLWTFVAKRVLKVL